MKSVATRTGVAGIVAAVALVVVAGVLTNEARDGTATGPQGPAAVDDELTWPDVERMLDAWQRRRATTPLRTVAVVAACDREFRAGNGPGWEHNARQRIAAASRVFEAEFRIRFEVVAVRRWESANGFWTLGDLHYALFKGVERPPGALLIGFTEQHRKGYDRGKAFYFSDTLLVRTGRPDDYRPWPYEHETLLHELAHVFGAWHVDDRSSLMRANKRGPAVTRFDPVSAVVVAHMRELDFARRVHGLRDEQVRELTALFKLSRSTRTPLPVADALMVEAWIARDRAREDDALAYYERSLRLHDGADLQALRVPEPSDTREMTRKLGLSRR